MWWRLAQWHTLSLPRRLSYLLPQGLPRLSLSIAVSVSRLALKDEDSWHHTAVNRLLKRPLKLHPPHQRYVAKLSARQCLKRLRATIVLQLPAGSNLVENGHYRTAIGHSKYFLIHDNIMVWIPWSFCLRLSTNSALPCSHAIVS